MTAYSAANRVRSVGTDVKPLSASADAAQATYTLRAQAAAARWQTLSLTRLADNLEDGERADNWETTRRRAPLLV